MANLAVITAAGTSTRLAGPVKKQYRLLAGVPMLAHCYARFAAHPAVEGVILVVPPGDEEFCRRHVLAGCDRTRLRAVVPGGQTRRESVAAAVARVADEDLVLIHDGARPLVSADLISRVLAALAENEAVIPGIAVTDTLKRVDVREMVAETLDRSALRAVQTPQGFHGAVIRRAHDLARRANTAATDDAVLVEALGVAVKVVPGDPANLKVTCQEDLERLEFHLARRKPNSGAYRG